MIDRIKKCRVCQWQDALESARDTSSVRRKKYYTRIAEMAYEKIGETRDNRYRVLHLCGTEHTDIANAVRKFWLANKGLVITKLEERYKELLHMQDLVFENLQNADPVQAVVLQKEFTRIDKQLKMLLVNINRHITPTRRKERDSLLIQRVYKPRIKKWQRTGEIKVGNLVIKLQGAVKTNPNEIL